MLDSERVEKLLERNVIEVAPIAFMRGRTLNDSFIILDEAQNSTPEQMKMVLTRQGFNSKMVVNGDITQIDLPNARRSGLIEATEVLKGVEGISFVQFDEKDVVRHTLVQRIVKAYEKYNETIGAGRQLTLKLAEPEAAPAARTNRSAGLSAAMSSPKAVPSRSAAFRRTCARARSELFARKLRTRGRQGPRVRLPDHRRCGTAPSESQFRGKDYATTCSRSPPSRARSGRHLGDLAISAARARAQAREFGHTTEDEIRILMLHGVLHLLGLDHETDARPHGPRGEALARANSACPTA